MVQRSNNTHEIARSLVPGSYLPASRPDVEAKKISDMMKICTQCHAEDIPIESSEST